MSDLSIVPDGFNEAISEYTISTGNPPKDPISFVSNPSFEFYRDPVTGSISTLSGLGLLASRVLYKLFSPIGSYAVDTTRGSYLEDILGDAADKPSLIVEIVRSIQKVEEELREQLSTSITPKNLDEALDSIKLLSVSFNEVGSANIKLLIRSQSGKVASLRLGV